MIPRSALGQGGTNGQDDDRHKHQQNMYEAEKSGVDIADCVLKITPEIANNRTLEVQNNANC